MPESNSGCSTIPPGTHVSPSLVYRRNSTRQKQKRADHVPSQIVRITKDVAKLEAEGRTCRAELNDERRMHLMAIR